MSGVNILLSNKNTFHALECSGVFLLCTDSDKERLGRLAIKSIHEQMDDDKDGMIEASESRDVIHSFSFREKRTSKRYFNQFSILALVHSRRIAIEDRLSTAWSFSES